MPIYDYVCGSCRHRFEVFHGLNESGPHQCPECGGPVSRAFAPPTIVFKGSGWAKVDRRATASPGRARTSRSSEESGGETTASTGDRAPKSGDAATKSGDAAPSSKTASTPAASSASSGGPDA